MAPDRLARRARRLGTHSPECPRTRRNSGRIRRAGLRNCRRAWRIPARRPWQRNGKRYGSECRRRSQAGAGAPHRGCECCRWGGSAVRPASAVKLLAANGGKYAPVALGGAAGIVIERRLGREPPHFSSQGTPGDTLVGFFVQPGRPRCRPAYTAYRLHDHFDGRITLAHRDTIARADFTGWFDRLAVDQHPALANFIDRQRARLVETRRPQPFIDS